jgi:signal peptidase II
MDSPAASPGPSDDSEPAPDEAQPAPAAASGKTQAAPEGASKAALAAPEGQPQPPLTQPSLLWEPSQEPVPSYMLPVPAPAPAGPPWSPSMAFLGVVALVVTAADLGSKEWAKYALAGPDLKRSTRHIAAIPNLLDFIFAQNPGGAWSFLRNMPDGLRRPFFLFVSAAAIVFIVTVYGRLEKRQWAMRWGLPLALGGAIGNLADRVRYGWVVDFIDLYWKRGVNDEVHWPTFNVADIAIVVGVGMMALDLLSMRRTKGAAGPGAARETASGAA